jgi:DNA-binding transcriptional MocR family regulator
MTSFEPLNIALNHTDALPLYQQIKSGIIAAIERGELPPSTRLPATRRLAKQLGVNRVTVVTAYAELTAEGYIDSHVGRGSFVLDRAISDIGAAVNPPSLRKPSDWTAHNFNREMMRLARRPDILSFAPGMPATDLLPVNDYRLALNTVLRRDGPTVLQYGLIEGYPPLHAAIVRELAGLDIQAEPDQLLVTSGTEQGLALILRTVLRSGDAILIEQPTYMHVLDLLAGSGIQVHPVVCDDQGIQLDLLPDLIVRYRPKLLYLTPTYQNPTGACMPLARRQRLLDLIVEHDLLVLEDDVYRHLWLDKPSPPPLRALDPADNVIYTSGYSKCLLPGARIGYLLPPARLLPDLAASHQTLDITATELQQRALAVVLEQGRFPEHLEKVREAHRQRRQAMLDALAKYMPPGAYWTQPRGGLYLWVQLPTDGPSATMLYVHALELGIAFAPGHLFYMPSNEGPPARANYRLRLNFAIHAPPVIHDGIRRLARAWERAAGLG